MQYVMLSYPECRY